MKLSQLDKTEFEEFYGFYLGQLDENTLLLNELKKGKEALKNYIENLSEEKGLYKYEIGKWTIKEVLVHITDAERVFQHRAFRFSRQEGVSLPGFDHNTFIKNSRINNRSLQSILKEYIGIRDVSITLFETFNDDELRLKGIASDIQWSVGGLGFVINGHQKHHLKILQEKYI